MKSSSIPKVDFKVVLEDFRSLNPKDVGTWPVVPRVAVLLVLVVVILLAGWWFLWNEQLDTLAARQQEEIKLRDEFVAKKTQAVNLDLYTQQLTEIDRSFGALLKQLPNKAEVESLLIEINQSGMGRGLQFELFKPGQEVSQEFYAELPISVKLTGSYHDLGSFAGDVAKMPRIVTLNNIIVDGTGGGSTLKMETTATTFRYLDEEELASQRRAKAAAAKPKAK